MDGSVNFYRIWETYRNGFGNLEKEFWLGMFVSFMFNRYPNPNRNVFFHSSIHFEINIINDSNK
jgi:hypothetical protein